MQRLFHHMHLCLNVLLSESRLRQPGCNLGSYFCNGPQGNLPPGYTLIGSHLTSTGKQIVIAGEHSKLLHWSTTDLSSSVFTHLTQFCLHKLVVVPQNGSPEFWAGVFSSPTQRYKGLNRGTFACKAYAVCSPFALFRKAGQ